MPDDREDESQSTTIVTKTEKARSPSKDRGVVEANREQIELDGRSKFFALRGRWSWFILVWISLLIFFNMRVTWAIGKGELDFTEYEWFVTAVTVETFLQVVGLGYVAVKFLFSDGKP